MTYTKEQCIKDTHEHIDYVALFLHEINKGLKERARVHDQSKLEEPELSIFIEFTPKLAGSTYGSEEYKQSLEGMKKALEHHYKHNSHHPEHYPNGIDDMDLLDVVEMLADWKSATLRHDDGDIRKSLEINKERFNISPQLYSILKNTVDRMNW